jgi:catechol 2,3-dioxygenase-like lactoylglutathione lyase family enzyme
MICLHHVNIPAHNVQQSVAFFRDIIGLTPGVWNSHPGTTFNAGPDNLAIFGDDNRGLHVVKPVPDFAKKQGLLLNPTIGGHFAITVPDLDTVKRRLQAANIMYSDGGNFMPGVINMYCYDPSMNLIEINQVIK